jgi:hypothetical protein
MTRTRYRAECKAAMQDTLLHGLALTLTDVAHEQPRFTSSAVLERQGQKGRRMLDALNVLTSLALNAGALRIDADGAYVVVDEEDLCGSIHRYLRAA